MIRHLFTLVWNRKRANGLLTAQIFLAFIVLFAVSSIGVYLSRNYQSPLGFAYENVWRIDLNAGTQARAAQFGTLQRVLRDLRDTPGVVRVSRGEGNTPFSFSDNSFALGAGTGADKREADPVDVYSAGPELREVLGLRLREGRWFDRRDEAPGRRPPMVITELTRAALFPAGRPVIGQTVRTSKEEFEVIGVSGPYRAGGELSEPRPGVFRYVGPQDTASAFFTLLVRVRPGSGAALKKQISASIRAAGWSSTIGTLPEQRLAQLKFKLTPPVILGVVCLFLIINVALGLFGVLWQTISQRRAEIGVRRAMGATAGAVSGQIVGEILVVATFGLTLGLLVAVQFPLLGVLNVPASVYLTAMGLATATLYALAVGCALYPSRLAAGIHPAVALREE